MRNKEQPSNWQGFFGEAKPVRRRPRNLEHTLQSRCVRWFRLTHRDMVHNLFAVPNGGYRTKTLEEFSQIVNDYLNLPDDE